MGEEPVDEVKVDQVDAPIAPDGVVVVMLQLRLTTEVVEHLHRATRTIKQLEELLDRAASLQSALEQILQRRP